MAEFELFTGEGRTLTARGRELPPHAAIEDMSDGAGYRAEKGLRDAVNVALMLGRPLLLTGEPGTGKTTLARALAHELGLGDPLVFNAKTTSTARDLFYRYDLLAHFHDAQFNRENPPAIEKYIEYEALGLAVLRAEEKAASPVRSVVLIDEIDKAPRDLPNDVLNEIEAMAFTVRETGKSFKTQAQCRPIVTACR